jgi:hypothetical protein
MRAGGIFVPADNLREAMSTSPVERRVLALATAKARTPSAEADEAQRELWLALRRALIAEERSKRAVVKLIEQIYSVDRM